MRLGGRQVKISPARRLPADNNFSSTAPSHCLVEWGHGDSYSLAKLGAPAHTAVRDGEGVLLEL